MYDNIRYIKTAILVDGGFYRRRAQTLFGEKTAAERADELSQYCYKHLNEKHEHRELLRVFYYDCPPMEKQVYHPFLKRTVNFKKTDLYTWSNEFLNELKKKRKFALRLGKLSDTQAHYNIRPDIVKRLLSGTLELKDLTEHDFFISVDQKGVDMKIGLDIASMAYKKQVEQIILISADSDFTPAAKLARREGIDFILDPMGSTIKSDLHEHIDGIRSVYKKLLPKSSSVDTSADDSTT